ncbi:hypothetical protein PQR71_29205 [Paraburkholderia fungorum]|uniref:hypothetical protein n=1 Tax=Paraburkholderia fungorum TaxID=134537 RepID=UPI0038BA921D
MSKQFKVGDSIRCTKPDTFLAIKTGQRYTVCKLGAISNDEDMEYVQLAELPGRAFKAERFMLCTSK